MRLLLLALALALSSCGLATGGGSTVPSGDGAPALSRQQVAELAVRADVLRTRSLGSGAQSGLTGTFAGPAADLVRRQAARVQRLREYFDTVVDFRALVHWSISAGEVTAVVQSSGRQRFVGPSGTSAWDRFVDQWLYTLRWSGGWRVWAAADVAPDQWWPS